MHFTPTSASWLNMVERSFRDLTQNTIRHDALTSVKDLKEAMKVYLLVHNDEPKAYTWTAKATDLLAHVTRARAAQQRYANPG